MYIQTTCLLRPLDHKDQMSINITGPFRSKINKDQMYISLVTAVFVNRLQCIY